LVWWVSGAVTALLSSSCFDFDKAEREFCDSGTSAACPKVERCDNGVDDDGDQRADCADPDCLGQSCTGATNACAVSTVCQANGTCGESPITCNSPPNFCFRTPGACDADSGTCAYSADTSVACDDANRCTSTDHCLLDGGCGGTLLTCSTPPGACFNAAGACDPVLGCTYPVRIGACDDGDACTSSDLCIADGGCSGTPYSCPSTECATRSCLGDGACLATVRTGQPCDAGICQASGSCVTFSYPPSNFDPVAIAARGIAGNVVVGCNAWFDSTDGGGFWCAGQPVPAQTVVPQAGAQDVMVLAMSGLSVTGSLTLTGTRPVILAVWGDATVNGTISARSVTGQDAGAGAYPAGQCEIVNGQVAAPGDVASGGGGAGGSTPGGTGGDLSGGGGIPGGGPAAPRGVATLIPLQGGCNGGAGGRANDAAGVGGAGGKGGGAVQLSAAGTLQVSGTITASGAGGHGGLQDQVGSASEGGNGGGGGGAGGEVLLEGRDVSVMNGATLTANGGGGGEGGDSQSSGNRGNAGADGPSNAPSGGAGGSGAVPCAGNGASGGSASGAPGDGNNIGYSFGGCATGGGGGAAGRIRVNASQTCQVNAGTVSPVPTYGGPCP
jgi:hypothetical protein